MKLLFVTVSFIFGYVLAGPCKMSPLTTFLTDQQQRKLHDLIVLARNSGADEGMVKDSMDEYLAQILSPDRLLELKTAHDEFEAQRRGKRATGTEYEKPEPKKVFDIIDQLTSDYQKFYEESAPTRNRNKNTNSNSE